MPNGLAELLTFTTDFWNTTPIPSGNGSFLGVSADGQQNEGHLLRQGNHTLVVDENISSLF
jgi:hypothetical protein